MTGRITTSLEGIAHGSLSMTITRADGTVEDLGVVAETAPERRSILTILGGLLCRKR
ncbi:hypothetical protein [Sphingomonas sp. GC_Shp_3]|uniref:hypothetical protein n=1 Tax=Sphingomonas sp. GC_Shp_3 TaxID=2937383 RepID=UPI002269F1F0|nr:hypothetical protein [Sphingomonas sp. GC_Shp_3]